METTARAQHTAGPWQVGSTNNILTDIADENYTRALATVWTHKRNMGDPQARPEAYAEGVANARLIAAAPALLAALEAALEIHTHTMDAGGDNWPACNGCGNDQSRGTSHHPQCWVLIARAAIRQARGDD